MNVDDKRRHHVTSVLRQGSTFANRIPVAQGIAALSNPGSELDGLEEVPRWTNHDPRNGTLSVLVADDDPLWQRLLHSKLARQGFSVRVAKS